MFVDTSAVELTQQKTHIIIYYRVIILVLVNNKTFEFRLSDGSVYDYYFENRSKYYDKNNYYDFRFQRKRTYINVLHF